MTASNPEFFRARDISSALGVGKRTVHRRARRERWPKRRAGNRFLYAPPGGLPDNARTVGARAKALARRLPVLAKEIRIALLNLGGLLQSIAQLERRAT